MINNVVLAGNVVNDPEKRSTSTGKSVANFRLAVNNPFDENDTLFIKVETWGKTADMVEQHIKKGKSVGVIGRLKLDTWESNGEKRSMIHVVAERVTFLGPKTADAGEASQGNANAAPQARGGRRTRAVAQPAPATVAAGIDEDVPF